MERIQPTRKIIVKPYDPGWAFQFLSESECLSDVLKDEILSIHHIGSTAIPGIESKPTIDILVEVKDIGLVDQYNPEMETQGYQAKGEYGIHGRRFFIKECEAERLCHVHIFQNGDPEISRHLNFRDYMIYHADDAAAYGKLKQELAKRYPEDIKNYSAGKDSFIKEIDRKAGDWKRHQQSGASASPRRDENEVVSLCQRLVKMRSDNPPGNELNIAAYILEYLREAGFQGELVPHTASRASLIARLPGSGLKKDLLFSAHMDTVPVGAEAWVHDPFGGEISDGKIWGRGTCDMKGGLAAMLVAARNLAQSGMRPGGDLILALSAGEEVDMIGAKALVQRSEFNNLQAILVSEPTNNDLIIAEKGILWIEITTHGKTAHGSMPEFGRNAIRFMLAVIDELDHTDFPYVEHPLLGKFSRSLNTIHGGLQTNIIPDQCKVTFDMRTVPGQDHAEIIQKFESVLNKLKTEIADFSASLRITQNGVPLSTPLDDPLVGCFTTAIQSVTGVRPTPKGVRYFTDAAIFMPKANAPLVICGPGPTEMAHQPDEYVEIEKLVHSAQIYSLVAQQLLS
ncbi:MAG: ArgE/DapE family deacylase [Anaerolineae bacterium]|nr:ArgE/DapE family deacylase [Anaerolineae bacterium]